MAVGRGSGFRASCGTVRFLGGRITTQNTDHIGRKESGSSIILQVFKQTHGSWAEHFGEKKTWDGRLVCVMVLLVREFFEPSIYDSYLLGLRFFPGMSVYVEAYVCS